MPTGIAFELSIGFGGVGGKVLAVVRGDFSSRRRNSAIPGATRLPYVESKFSDGPATATEKSFSSFGEREFAFPLRELQLFVAGASHSEDLDSTLVLTAVVNSAMLIAGRNTPEDEFSLPASSEF